MNMTERKDAWTAEDDSVLAGIILKQIREGGTQLAAFEEAAGALRRTASACGFRWNAVVRKQFEQEIRIAKQQRKNAGAAVERMDESVISAPRNMDPLDAIIAEMKKYKVLVASMVTQIRKLEDENKELKQQLDEKSRSLEEDYKEFIQILHRARQLGVLEKIG